MVNMKLSCFGFSLPLHADKQKVKQTLNGGPSVQVCEPQRTLFVADVSLVRSSDRTADRKRLFHTLGITVLFTSAQS